MDFFLEWVIGAIVWTFANVVYVDLRRKGQKRGRVISFIAGWPGTLVSLFVVEEGRIPRIEPPDDDDERLLREIRVDRELREDRLGRLPHGAARGGKDEAGEGSGVGPGD